MHYEIYSFRASLLSMLNILLCILLVHNACYLYLATKVYKIGIHFPIQVEVGFSCLILFITVWQSQNGCSKDKSILEEE